jgi:hypothetical protein
MINWIHHDSADGSDEATPVSSVSSSMCERNIWTYTAAWVRHNATLDEQRRATPPCPSSMEVLVSYGRWLVETDQIDKVVVFLRGLESACKALRPTGTDSLTEEEEALWQTWMRAYEIVKEELVRFVRKFLLSELEI